MQTRISLALKTMVFVGFLFSSFPAHSASSALNLAEICKTYVKYSSQETEIASEDGYNFGKCQGTFDTWRLILLTWDLHYFEGGKVNICLPSGATPRQLALVFLRFIEENPNRGNEESYIIVYHALEDAFSCN